MDKRVIADFLGAGGSVCPFAQTAVLHYVSLPDREGLTAFSKTFGSNPPHALVVLSHSHEMSFHTTRGWAIHSFLELAFELAVISGHPKRLVKQHVRDEIKPHLANETGMRPFLAVHGEPVFIICMAPVYPKTHPRYAPHPILVVTWHRDVGEASKSDAFMQRVRVAMVAGHGSLYDADELMLPLPGKKTP